jgi:predicted transposase/invertase (TIGR01784 family)
LFTGQDIHGEDKSYNDLKETYQIAILAKQKFFPDENFAHNFLYYDPDNRTSLGGRTRIITVELVKTEPIIDKPVEEMTDAELWAAFFQYLTDEEKRGKINEIIKRKECIAMVVETLGTFTQSEIEYIYETRRIMGELDYNTEMAERRAKARDEGRQEGLAEGRQEGIKEGIKEGMEKGHAEKAIEVARNALAQGASIDFVNKITGLDIETIKQLANKP